VFAFGQVAPPSGAVPAALPVSAVVLMTKATLPPLTARFGLELLGIGVGSATPQGALLHDAVLVAASWTR